MGVSCSNIVGAPAILYGRVNPQSVRIESGLLHMSRTKIGCNRNLAGRLRSRLSVPDDKVRLAGHLRWRRYCSCRNAEKSQGTTEAKLPAGRESR